MMKRTLVVGLAAAALAASAAEQGKKKWSVDEETRKMVQFETGKDLASTVETGDKGPEDRNFYGPGTRERMLAHMKETGRRTTWVENGVLYLDGKPYLRCGLYAIGYCTAPVFAERLKADNPGCDWEWDQLGIEFGRLVPGSEQREGRKAQKPSQEVLDKVARTIEANRDRDFGYYYLCDEPECRSISPVYLRYLYHFIKERDPYHVILICSRAAERYITCCDWIEVHPYLAPRYNSFGKREFGTELHTFGNYVEGVVAMNRPDKVIGCTPTAFGYLENSFDHDIPTFDEYVASVWAVLLDGGRSIYPFIGNGLAKSHDIYEGVRYTFSSAKALQDFLLFGTRTRLEKNEDWAATAWERDGERMFAVVNFLPKPQKVALKGVSGNFREFRGTRRFTIEQSNNQTILPLRPFEVIVATTKPCDGDLASLADVKANLARLNDARLRRDNQILGRSRELEFASSGALSLQQGICNGMLQDQTAHFRGGNSWYEIGFPAGAIEFDRVLLHGDNLDKTTVSVRQAGEWVELQDAKRSVEPHLVTLTLPAVCHTVRVRFEFHQDHAMLCEIEFPRVKGGKPLAHPKAGLRYIAPDNLPTPNPDFHFSVTDKPVKPKAVSTPVNRVLEGQQCLVFDASNADIHTNGWSGGKWYGNPLQVEKPADGSFVLGPSGATHQIKFNPKWRWIDFEIPREAVKTTERGYSNWGLGLLSHPGKQAGLAGNVRSSQPGLYTIPFVPVEKESFGYIQLGEINMHVPFNYIRFCENPPTRLEARTTSTNGVVRAGDTVGFRLTLEKPCEDVSLSFNVDHAGPRPFAINGSSSLGLKRLDDTGCLWGGVVLVKRLGETGGGVYAKVRCYGGEQVLPVLTRMPWRFEK